MIIDCINDGLFTKAHDQAVQMMLAQREHDEFILARLMKVAKGFQKTHTVRAWTPESYKKHCAENRASKQGNG